MKPTSILSDLSSYCLQSLIPPPPPHPTPPHPTPPAHPPSAHAPSLLCSLKFPMANMFLTPTFQLGLNTQKNERRRQTACKRNPSFHNNPGKTMSQVLSQLRCAASVPRGTNAVPASLDVVAMSSCEWEILVSTFYRAECRLFRLFRTNSLESS